MAEIKISESPSPRAHLKAMSNTECIRIADQVRRAFEGKAWHGPSLRELLTDVTVEGAEAHPMASGHSIWELVLHITVWTQAAFQATNAVPMPKIEIVGTPEDWPPVTDSSVQAWSKAVNRMFETGKHLSGAIEQFGDHRLSETVAGRQYDFYYLLHGIAQHSLYHGGQIAILRKAT